MTQQEGLKVAQAFALTAAYYRVRIDDQILKMYAEDVADLPFDDVIKALGAYRRNPKNRQMPLPAHIREIIEPVETPESKAREIASKISGAVVKFGQPNENLAREYIGETGWAIVARRGGWSHICSTADSSQLYSQIRDHAFDVVRRPDSITSFPTALPPAKQNLLSGEHMPDGEPVEQFEFTRQEKLKKLYEDMDRRKAEVGL